MESFRILGLMSGTSLDGLDIADVVFERQNSSWYFKIINSETIPYDNYFVERLKGIHQLSSTKIFELNADLGNYFGRQVNRFISKHEIDKNTITAVASHGHTAFHQPNSGYTTQLGTGSEGTVITQLKWITDFRSKDVALGGNGAPLVPIGDRDLFNDQAHAFVNLGGFSNISYALKKEVYAFDICPVNIVLNYFSQKITNQNYDKDGNLGRKGKVDAGLLQKMNNLQYYQLKHPKSLGVEWLSKEFFPLIDNNADLIDVLATCYKHISEQISRSLNEISAKKALFTGGGAFNKYLINLIRESYNGQVVLPDAKIIDYKEAIVFAYLGLLRLENKVNVLASVTGASRDSCSGVIHLP